MSTIDTQVNSHVDAQANTHETRCIRCGYWVTLSRLCTCGTGRTWTFTQKG